MTLTCSQRALLCVMFFLSRDVQHGFLHALDASHFNLVEKFIWFIFKQGHLTTLELRTNDYDKLMSVIIYFSLLIHFFFPFYNVLTVLSPTCLYFIPHKNINTTFNSEAENMFIN